MRKVSISRSLIEVLVLGLIVRLWAMRWPPLATDMNAWIGWGERLWEVGPGGFYTDTIFADYAPGYLYVLWLTAAIKHAIFPSAGVELYHFLYRLPPILFDLATSALIFLMLRQAHRRDGRTDLPGSWLPTLGAVCFAFSPAALFNGAIWGQIDSVFTFFMVLALALLLQGRLTTAAVSYVIAFLIKPQAVSLVPLIAVVSLLRSSPRRWLTAAVTGVALAFCILFPFFGWSAFPQMVALLGKSVETYPHTSLFMYNLWGIYGFWQDDRVASWLGVSLRTMGTLLYGAGLIYGVALLAQFLRPRADLKEHAFLFATYFTWLPVMVLTRMHERYLYPVLPFLLVFAVLYQIQCLRMGKRVMAALLTVPFLMYLFLTVVHTMNLYQVYTYYFHYSTGGVPRSNVLFHFADQNSRLWSVLTLAAFVAFAASLPSWSAPDNPAVTLSSLRDEIAAQEGV